MKPTAEEQIAIRRILIDYHRRDDYDLTEAEVDIICLMEAHTNAVKSVLPPAEGADTALHDGLDTFPIPAEGAEEILQKEFPLAIIDEDEWTGGVLKIMQEHTALHAQRLADKMVSERMPTEKDAIDYAADWATELDDYGEPHTDIEKMDYFLQGERWFRSRMKGENK